MVFNFQNQDRTTNECQEWSIGFNMLLPSLTAASREKKFVASLVAAGGHVGALAGAMMAGSCRQHWSAHNPKSTCAVKALEEGLKKCLLPKLCQT